MVARPLRLASLCAGIGGLDLGFHLASPISRTVLYVERELACVKILVSRAREKFLDDAPVWSDVATLDAERWRGAVDCVLAGFPCQPWSVAGKKQGTADARWLWPSIARIVCGMECEWVFLENVPGARCHPA